MDKSDEYWVDVEVPYNKIVEKWDRKYAGRMNQHMTNGRLQGKILSIYFNILGNDEFSHDRSAALESLETLNMELVYNLCCQFEFSTRISGDVIEKYAKENKSAIVDLGFEEEFDKNIGEGDNSMNKDGLVALCQLANPDSLRNILIHARASGQYPSGTYKRSSSDPPTESEWNEVIEQLSGERGEDYAIWHQFTKDNERYVAVEEEDRDGVERQVGGNIEKEPANLVILHFNDGYLDIYSDTREVANRAQTGVNSDISGEEYEKDKNQVSPDDVGDLVENVTSKDKERDQGNIDIDYIMTGLRVNRTGLPNNPDLKLTSPDGVGTAVEELESEDYQITSDSESIDWMKIQFEGNIFTVNQNIRNESTDGAYTELIYGTSAQPETREKFENLIKSEFGISVKYSSTN